MKGVIAEWAVNGVPRGISVNKTHNLLVTCAHIVNKIKEFTSSGCLLREIALPDDVVNPWHAIQSRSGQFIVCHGYDGNPINRVCIISADGRHIVHSHGGQSGSDNGQYTIPRHLAVDDNESVFIADIGNRRVTLLSSTLEDVHQIVSPQQLKWCPYRLFLDVRRRRLYVTENDFRHFGDYKSGRVVVFTV